VDETEPTEPRLDHLGRYDVMGFRAEVRSNSAALIATLDRLNAHFLDMTAAPPDGVYEAISYDGDALWELTFQDEELCFREGLERAASHVEWHVCDQAIARRQELLHVHGAAVCSERAAVLLPGKSGIGKTTFALAITLRARGNGDGRVRLLSDDVVFLQTDTWQPQSFARAFHIHDDALPRLAPLGLHWTPEDHIGGHLCSTVLGDWDRTPGPPLRYVVFPHLVPDEPVSLERISEAEATVELMRCSKNLRSFPRFGLELIPRLLSQVECYILKRNDDLVGAADVLLGLLQKF
jgi:hypothetical protein